MTSKTATERLSELLDGRKQAHRVWPSGLVVWHEEGSWVYEYSPPKAEGDYWGGILHATLRHCTPEQAVAATLGSGKLTAEQVQDAVLENFEETHETRYDHWEPSRFDWQAIADELNAAMGRETCEETEIYKFFRGCPKCRYVWEYMYDIGHRVGPNFCPRCGAKVRKAVEA